MGKKDIILVLLFAFFALSGRADVKSLRGTVLDSISGEPIPYAAVYLRGTSRGMIANENGEFNLANPGEFKSLAVSSMGYTPKEIKYKDIKGELTIRLSPTGVRIKEIVVKPGKEHYSKKNNPAVEFARRLRERQGLTDPRQRPNYNYDRYERITLGMNDVNLGDSTAEANWMIKKFPFLREHIDTSALTGRPVLNLAIREKASTIHYRHDPESEKEVIKGIKQAGIDEILDPESMMTFYEDVMREVDIYDNDINIFQNRFVSPLSHIAPDFYKFYLTDTVTINKERCIELTFVPHNAASFGFVGRIYVPENDSTMFVRRIVMNVPKDINLNFINKLYIEQDYVRDMNGSRLKTRDEMIVEASLIPGTQGLYAHRNTSYSNHDFEQISDQTIFGALGRTITEKEAESRDDEFWEKKRSVKISKAESSVADLMARLRQVPAYYWTEKFLKIMVNGYIETGKHSKIDIGPMNTTISGNTIEGVRLRAGAMTTANLSKHWFGRGYVAYGTRDHRWKYMGEAEYSFNEKKYHSREFPVHSIRATHLYDVDMIGQHYLFTNPDNMFLSLKRMKDTQMTYHRLTKLEYTLELENNFSLVAGVHSNRQIATEYVPFVDGFGTSFDHYTMTSFEIQLRYAPGEKFFQMKTMRVPVNLDAPVFLLRHSFAPGGKFSNRFTLNKTELSISKRFWFSAFGYLDAIVTGGHVWSKVPYLNLCIPNANLSYTIQPESFALMNPMEFINDSYAQWDLTYWANGAILNNIPLVKKLRLREVFGFRGVWGQLSDRNNPELHPELYRFPVDGHTQKMTSTPYMEVSAGLDNIFTILRLDYVWRLTYRDAPGISKGGLRLALHFTF